MKGDPGMSSKTNGGPGGSGWDDPLSDWALDALWDGAGGLSDTYNDYPSDGYPDGYGPDEYRSLAEDRYGPGERSEWE
jgi:hypothetical protein